jgi:hypothetical protein
MCDAMHRDTIVINIFTKIPLNFLLHLKVIGWNTCEKSQHESLNFQYAMDFWKNFFDFTLIWKVHNSIFSFDMTQKKFKYIVIINMST